MVLQYFILGRNPTLSGEEIRAYARARNIQATEILFDENYLLLDVKKEIDINELGGTIKAGVIEAHGREDEVTGYLLANEIIQADKFTYGVFGNAGPEMLKYKFKIERKKAMHKHGRARLDLQDEGTMLLPKADYYLIMHEHEGTYYFGQINQSYDTKAVEQRDMHKPVRREQLAISPRLAKILINLSEAKKGDTLLDPFCGVGGIVHEALLKGITTYAYDRDPLAIRDAKKNLAWFTKTHTTQAHAVIKQKDAKDIESRAFDAIATETPLGDVVLKIPRDDAAQRMIHSFERKMIPLLRHLQHIKKKDARIAITFPKIRTHEVDYATIQEETNLTMVIGPITEAREGQFVGRVIVVFV